jgi:hypothetical protein
MRRLGIGILVILLAVAVTVWYKLRSAEELAPEPRAIARPVSLGKSLPKVRQPAVVRDRPSRDRSARPGEPY